MPDAQDQPQILYAETDENVVIVTVVGRANFGLSPKLKQLADSLNPPDDSRQYVVDLQECPTLDSTFMGVMAAIALRQKLHCKNHMAILNANPTTQRQLGVLGLTLFLDVFLDDSQPPIARNIEFKTAPEVPQSPFERVVHMIESHQTLIDANSGNEIKFRNVITTLSDDLDKKRQTGS